MPRLLLLPLLLLFLSPLPLPAQDRLNGEISILPDKLAGKETASGEKYAPDERSAAHRTLPLGSLAWVTNQANGKSVLVRIIERGPASKKQEMALSRAAAEAIGVAKTAPGQIVPLDLSVRRPAPAAGDEYAIAIASYPDMLRAVYRQMALERAGVANVKVQRLTRQGKVHFRVIIGGFPSPEAADLAASDLEARKLIEPK